MEILDRPEVHTQLHWSARYAKWMEVTFLGLYIIGHVMHYFALPFHLVPMYLGLLGWIVTYAIVYPTWVLKIKDSLSNAQAIMFTWSFISLAIYVLSILADKVAYHPLWSVESIERLDIIINVLSSVSIIGILSTCLYCLFVKERIGKKEPQAYNFAIILWPRLFFLTVLFVIVFAIVGIKL